MGYNQIQNQARQKEKNETKKGRSKPDASSGQFNRPANST
jgi:hypothetical protein